MEAEGVCVVSHHCPSVSRLVCVCVRLGMQRSVTAWLSACRSLCSFLRDIAGFDKFLGEKSGAPLQSVVHSTHLLWHTADCRKVVPVIQGLILECPFWNHIGADTGFVYVQGSAGSA